MTRYTREYLEFRDGLNNDQLLNFRAQLKNALSDGLIQDNRLTFFQVGGAVHFHIYVDRHLGVIWLLGGHWVRKGEPTEAFLERMEHYARELSQGREPH
jgi:hypothetical protein